MAVSEAVVVMGAAVSEAVAGQEAQEAAEEDRNCTGRKQAFYQFRRNAHGCCRKYSSARRFQNNPHKGNQQIFAVCLRITSPW